MPKSASLIAPDQTAPESINSPQPPIFTSTPELRSFLKGLLVIISLAVLWVFILPGLVAWQGGVFYDHQIKAKLTCSAAHEYQKYLLRRQALDDIEAQSIERLKHASDATKPFGEVQNLTDILRAISNAKQVIRAPIHPTGFLSDEAGYVFFIHFIFLGILYLLSMPERPRISIRLALLFGLAIYTLFAWPNWLRNFILNEYFPNDPTPGRTVYAWVHWDIDPLGFSLQEARIFSMFLFDAVLWQIWISHSTWIDESARDWSAYRVKLDAFADRALLLTHEFYRWQNQSFLLICAFLPWTWFFWRKVYEQNDLRYTITAVSIHVVWAVSWFILSMSTIRIWRKWSDYRQKALNSVLGRARDDPDAERIMELFKDAAPVPALNVFGAGATVVISMLLPLLHVFFKTSG